MGVMPQRFQGRIRREIAPLGEDDRARLRALFERDVATNIFMLSWMENYGVTPRRAGTFEFRGVFEGDELRSAALVITERLVLLSAELDDARALGAHYARRGARFGHVVSSRAPVEAFWQAYVDAFIGSPPPRVRLKSDQRVYELDTLRWDELGGSTDLGDPTGLRRAGASDLDALLLASARMHLEETHEDPLERDALAFRGHVRHRIETGRSYVWLQNHRLVFKADVSAQSRYGVQISGVFTEPRDRGRGVATRAMRDLCGQLLDRGWPRVTLYVNEDNLAARKVYERVGFEAKGPYTTIFVKSGR